MTGRESVLTSTEGSAAVVVVVVVYSGKAG
jgi:hypothetical protein